MKRSKPRSSISKKLIDEEAHGILDVLLETPDSANQIGMSLNSRYTPSPRQKILERIAKLIDLRKPQLEDGVLTEFAETQWNGVTSVSMVKHIRSVLFLLFTESPRSAAKLFCRLAEGKKKAPGDHVPFVDGPTVRLVASGIVKTGQLGELLAESLDYAREKGMTGRAFLENWYNALIPAIGPRGIKNSINELNASRILDNLSHVDLADVPEELIFAMPLLIALADGDVVAVFHKTKLGQMIPFPGDGKPLDKAGHHSEQAEILHALKKIFGRTELLVSLLEEKLQTNSDLLIENNKLYQSLDMKARSLLRRDEELAMQNAELLRKNTEIGQELEDLRKKEAIWAREIRLRDQEMETRLRLMEDGQKEDIRRLCSAATRNLKEHVQVLLEENADTNKFHMLGVAFDSLHTKLLRTMGEPGNLRIPQELLVIEGEKDE